MTKIEVWIALACVVVFAVGTGCYSDEEVADSVIEPVSAGTTLAVSSADVMNVLSSNCLPCHSAGVAKEELELDTLEGLMNGSEHGDVVLPGNSADSLIVKALRGDGVDQMPYEKDPLSEADIKLIEEWIDAGAPQS